MAADRAEPGPRAGVRPRYGRIVAASGALLTTTVSVLGGLGVIATGPVAADTGRPGADVAGVAAGSAGGTTTPQPQPVQAGTVIAHPWEPPDATLPDESGEGRRAVFSESRQQVWLVGDDEEVQRTYLVSGSLYDNLEPGTYEVYSRSRDAVGVDDSGTMRYFVRFTVGDSAAIGFHDIPEQDGAPVQSLDELGTPLSHGCIRQRREDAIAMWEFAQLGATVVVTA